MFISISNLINCEVQNKLNILLNEKMMNKDMPRPPKNNLPEIDYCPWII
jgi:hypothetical protein